MQGDTIQPSQHNPPLEDIAAALSGRMLKNGATPMTGPLKLADGTMLAPSATFATDPSTGLYKTAGGFAVAIGGTKVAEFVSTGIKGVRYIGEIINVTDKQLPPLCIWPYGQTLSRTTYADLWAYAQTAIANGSTSYNNGNGSTTFGVMDARGRALFGRDDMGGTAANRITSTSNTSGGIVVGGAGGSQISSLLLTNLPPITPAGTITNGTITLTNGASKLTSVASGGLAIVGGGTTVIPQDIGVSQAASTFSGTVGGGSSTPFVTAPPHIIVDFCIFAGA